MFKLTPSLLSELISLSDNALRDIYGYDLSKPGTFGYKANQLSVTFAFNAISKGILDIEKISDAVHRGWSYAFRVVIDPVYKNKTLLPNGLTKGQQKFNDRQILAKTPYKNLIESEKEKDRVVARTVLSWCIQQDMV
jgi:hypothetical protein